MKKFEFKLADSGSNSTSVFKGSHFYNVYKNSEFLRSTDNIETILANGYQLRQMLKKIAPGETIVVEGMFLEKNTPMLIKRTGAQMAVEDFEFTYNRLTGLVAAYAFDNRLRLPTIKSSEAIALGLVWDNLDEDKAKLYLSSVSGTEHFTDQFSFWPLVCALRKLQLNKITMEPVIKMAKIKNADGVRMSMVLMNNVGTVGRLWKHFPGSNPNDLTKLLAVAPAQLKNLFRAD